MTFCSPPHFQFLNSSLFNFLVINSNNNFFEYNLHCIFLDFIHPHSHRKEHVYKEDDNIHLKGRKKRQLKSVLNNKEENKNIPHSLMEKEEESEVKITREKKEKRN